MKSVAFLLLVASLVGCGGSPEPSESSAESVTSCPVLHFSCMSIGLNVTWPLDGGDPPGLMSPPNCPTGCVGHKISNVAATDDCSITCVTGQ